MSLSLLRFFWSRAAKSLAPKPRPRRKPTSLFAPLGADIRLEDRCLLSVTAGIAASPTTVEQRELVSYTLTGEQTNAPPPLTAAGLFGSPGMEIDVPSTLTFIDDVEVHDGVLYFGGQLGGSANGFHVGVPAIQTVDLNGGGAGVGPVRSLPISDSSDPSGRVRDVAIVNGQVLFVGDATEVTALGNVGRATIWDLAFGRSTMTSSDPNDETELEASSPAGIVTGGGAFDHAAVGKIGGGLVILPETLSLGDVFGTGVSISDDGKWIVGGNGFGYGLWYTDTPDALDYTLQTIAFQANPNGGLPYVFRSVVLDPISGHYVAFGDYTDPLTVSDSVAAWDLSDGSLIRDFGAGTLDDVKVVGGHVVVAMNSLEDSYVTLLDDPATVQVRSLLADGAQLYSVNLARGGFQDEGGQVSLVVQTFDDNSRVASTRVLTFSYPTISALSVDPVTNATFHIDWNGDGVEDQVVHGDSGIVVQHAFAATGTQTTSVWIEAADGETSSPVSTTITVTQATQPDPPVDPPSDPPSGPPTQPDPLPPASVVNGVLAVTGGNGNDNVQVSPSGTGYVVHIGAFSQVFDGVNSVAITTGAGNDAISIVATVPVSVDSGRGDDALSLIVNGPITVNSGGGNDFVAVNAPYSVTYAGAGNDTVLAFGGRAAVFGQGGNDAIASQAAISLLVGGTGNDVIFGSRRRTLIVPGDADLSPAAVDQVFSIFGGNRRVATRLVRLVHPRVTLPRLPHRPARVQERDVVLAWQRPFVVVDATSRIHRVFIVGPAQRLRLR